MDPVMQADALDAYFDRLPEVLSIEQCAEALGIKIGTVYKRLRLPMDDPRKIPGFQPGGVSWVIYRDDIRAYVRRGANLPHPHDPNHRQGDPLA
jgi:hypothetical protein